MKDERFERFRLPLRANEVEWKVKSSKSGNTLIVPYTDARAVYSRLDACFGAGSWTNEFKEVSGGFICGISIYFPDTDKWVTKYDGASNTNIEPTKGGISDSLKRAAHAWGMGRELYDYPKVYIEGEHKHINYKPQGALNALVNAIASGVKINRRSINVTVDGGINVELGKPACTPKAFAKIIQRIATGESELIEKTKAHFYLTDDQQAILKEFEGETKKQAA